MSDASLEGTWEFSERMKNVLYIFMKLTLAARCQVNILGARMFAFIHSTSMIGLDHSMRDPQQC